MDPEAHRCLILDDDPLLPSKLALLDLRGAVPTLWWDLEYLFCALDGLKTRTRRDWLRWVKLLLTRSWMDKSLYYVMGPPCPSHFRKNVVSTYALLALLCMLVDSTQARHVDLFAGYLRHLTGLAVVGIPCPCNWHVVGNKCVEVDRRGLARPMPLATYS